MRTEIVCSTLVLGSSVAHAGKFGKKSGVNELNDKTFTPYLKTHKPVFMLMYAPWCGHCNAMVGDYEKLGKGLKDVVRVGAIDCDKHKSIGSQFGVQGFPTVKLWPMTAGTKKGKPQDYNGERKHAAMHKAALGEVKSNKVTQTKKLDGLTKLADKASAKKVAVLFSSKTKVPPMFSVLSYSPKLDGKIGFAMAAEKDAKEVAEKFEVEKFPTLKVITKDGDDLSAVAYDGAMEYQAIAKFLLTQLGEDPNGEEGGDEAEEKKEEKPKEKKPAKPSAPVRPEELTPDRFKTFCEHGSNLVKGKTPFCVISTLPADKLALDIDAIHAKFTQDPVLFFNPQEAAVGLTRSELESLFETEKLGHMVVLRAAKGGKTKWAHWEHESTDATVRGEAFEEFLARVLAGDATLSTSKGFPTFVTATQ